MVAGAIEILVGMVLGGTKGRRILAREVKIMMGLEVGTKVVVTKMIGRVVLEEAPRLITHLVVGAPKDQVGASQPRAKVVVGAKEQTPVLELVKKMSGRVEVLEMLKLKTHLVAGATKGRVGASQQWAKMVVVGVKDQAQVLEMVEAGGIKIKQLAGKVQIHPQKPAHGTQEMTQVLIVVEAGETIPSHPVLLGGLIGQDLILLNKMVVGKDKILADGTKEWAQVVEVVEVGGIMRRWLTGKNQVLKQEVGTKEPARVPQVAEVGKITRMSLVVLLTKMAAGKLQVHL